MKYLCVYNDSDFGVSVKGQRPSGSSKGKAGTLYREIMYRHNSFIIWHAFLLYIQTKLCVGARLYTQMHFRKMSHYTAINKPKSNCYKVTSTGVTHVPFYPAYLKEFGIGNDTSMSLPHKEKRNIRKTTVTRRKTLGRGHYLPEKGRI